MTSPLNGGKPVPQQDPAAAWTRKPITWGRLPQDAFRADPAPEPAPSSKAPPPTPRPTPRSGPGILAGTPGLPPSGAGGLGALPPVRPAARHEPEVVAASLAR